MTDLRDDGALDAGDVLDGRYRIDESIGEGGMGRVYRAEDLQLNRTVAIKTLRGPAGDPTTIERARAETTVLAALNHHALVTLFDATITDDAGGYLVLEHVDGITLRDLIAQGPVDPGELAALVRDLAEGLHVAHDSGVVHRDIKPANVLLSDSPTPGRRWRVKLADFGIAYLLDSERVTTPGMVIGTTAYLAPEQARGEAPAPAADIYAFGILLIEAITGVRPFPGAEGIAAVMARLAGPPEIPESLPDEWRGLLRGMTALEATDRPTALEVAIAAEGLMARDAASAVPAAPVAPAPEVPTAAAAAVAVSAPTATAPAGATPAAETAAPAPVTGPTRMLAVDDHPTIVLPPRPPLPTAAPAEAPPSRRRRGALLAGVAVSALVVAGIAATIWAGSLSAATTPSPTPSVTTPAAQPSSPAPSEPAPATDTGTGGGSSGTGGGNGGGNGNGGNGNGNGGNGNGNGKGNGKP